MAFLTSADGWLPESTPAQGQRVLFRSTDGGVHWVQQVLASPATVDLATTQSTTVSRPRFFGDAEGVLVLYAGTVDVAYTTDNRGASWVPAVPGSYTNVRFVSPMTGWAWAQDGQTGARALVASGDGGQRWSTLQMPAQRTPPFQLLGKGLGFLAGADALW